MSFKLRWYQEEAVASLFDYFLNNSGNPLVALPTGTGKSVIIGEFVKRALYQYPQTRIMMLTHVKELVEQNYEKLKAMWGNAPCGIYSAGLKKRVMHTPIIYGSMQSVIQQIKRYENGKEKTSFGRIDLLVVDECHTISEDATTSYRVLIDSLKKENPYLKVIGLTATPYRLKGGHLLDCGIFTDICYDLTAPDKFNKLFDQGYLCRVIPKRASTQIDTSNVKITAGDFNKKALAEISDDDQTTYNAVREIVNVGIERERKAWLVFGTSIEHCEHIQGMFTELGIESAVVHSKLSMKENDNIIKLFKSGRIRCLINNDKLTTGFDYPSIDLIGMLRATTSVGLWQQMVGRGLRIAEGKENCIVLDFAGNTQRLGAINDPIIPRRKGKKDSDQAGVAPMKICPQCDCYNHSRATECEFCGYKFPLYSKLNSQSSELELIKDVRPKYEQYEVKNVFYSKHRSKAGTTSLKVSYGCGLNTFTEYVCIEHQGFARTKAEQWFAARSDLACPSSVDEVLAIADTLKKPYMVTVNVNSKYKEISAVAF